MDFLWDVPINSRGWEKWLQKYADELKLLPQNEVRKIVRSHLKRLHPRRPRGTLRYCVSP